MDARDRTPSTYRHTEIAWATIALLVGVGLLLTWALTMAEASGVLGITLALTLSAGLLFYGLTVEVRENSIRASFGIGLISREVAVSEIHAHRRVKNPWYYGWGLRLIPGGWLWNVSGADALELTLTSGRVWRIGSPQIEALQASLRETAPQLLELKDDTAAKGGRTFGLILSSIVLVSLVGLGAAIVLMGRPIQTEVTKSALFVRSAFYGGGVPKTDILSVELLPTLPRIQSRTNGYAAGGTLRGYFRVEGLGSGRLFVETQYPPFVLVRLRRGYLVFNHADSERTRADYRALVKSPDSGPTDP